MLQLVANPWAIWLLPLLPMLGLTAWWALRRKRRALARLGSLSAILALTRRRNGYTTLRGLCLFAGLACVGIGVAGPQWGRDWEHAVATGRDVVVLLDISRSMLARDVLPSRLLRARQALLDLSDSFEKRGGHRLALVVFAARAKIVCPLTHDYNHFRQAVLAQDAARIPLDLRPSPEGPTSGTRIGAGLKMAIQAHKSAGPAPGMILLLSDGDDPARDREWREGALEAKHRQIPVFVIGVGDPAPKFPIHIPFRGDVIQREDGTRVTTRLEEEPLQEIARISGGSYYREGTNDLSLASLFRDAIAPFARRVPSDSAIPTTVQRYPWFFGAALVLLSLAMMIGGRPHLRMPADVKPQTAEERREAIVVS
jgi:Ca-activated chloride channel family protein